MLNLVLLPLSLQVQERLIEPRAVLIKDHWQIPIDHDCYSKLAMLHLLQKIVLWRNVCEMDNGEKDTNDQTENQHTKKKTEWEISIWAATKNNHLVLPSPSNHIG